MIIFKSIWLRNFDALHKISTKAVFNISSINFSQNLLSKTIFFIFSQSIENNQIYPAMRCRPILMELIENYKSVIDSEKTAELSELISSWKLCPFLLAIDKTMNRRMGKLMHTCRDVLRIHSGFVTSGGYHNGYGGRVGCVDSVVLWGGLDIYTSSKW